MFIQLPYEQQEVPTMNTVCVTLACWYFFIFAVCTGNVYGYLTSNSTFSVESAVNKSAANYFTSNPGKSKAIKTRSDSDYELRQNEAQYRCEDLHTCVQLLLLNVSDISRTNVYSLTENVVLERIAGGDMGYVNSRLDLDGKNGSFGYDAALLVQKTLDIFKTHSLKWKLIPGIDIRIFRNLNYGGRMDVALEVHDRGKTNIFNFQNFTCKRFGIH
jgi:hypothetical protein